MVDTVETTTMRAIKPALVAGELADRVLRDSSVRAILKHGLWIQGMN